MGPSRWRLGITSRSILDSSPSAAQRRPIIDSCHRVVEIRGDNLDELNAQARTVAQVARAVRGDIGQTANGGAELGNAGKGELHDFNS